MGDRLSHAHQSGPMPKVKEALPLATAGDGAAILLCIQWLLVAAPTPSPPGNPEKKNRTPCDVFVVLYIVAAKISLTIFSCFLLLVLDVGNSNFLLYNKN